MSITAAIYHVIIPGTPHSWQRVGRSRTGQAFTPRETKEAKTIIARAFQHAYPGCSAEPLTGRLGVRLLFFLRTRGQQDIDNLAKTVLDAGNGVIWRDDSQIDLLDVEIVCQPNEEPCTELHVFAL